MRPRTILIAALLLVVVVAAIIVGWAVAGDRPGPLNTRAFSHAQDMGLEPPAKLIEEPLNGSSEPCCLKSLVF